MMRERQWCTWALTPLPSSAATGSERALSIWRAIVLLMCYLIVEWKQQQSGCETTQRFSWSVEIVVLSMPRLRRKRAPQAIQVADRFHICKNLTEATQLLLARCQAEIVAASKREEPAQNESGQPIISIEEWRPKEPAHVEKVRLTRRAGREARYEQVMEGLSQGLTTKEIACQLGLSERTVQKWKASGTFPEVKKRRKKPSSFDPFAPYV